MTRKKFRQSQICLAYGVAFFIVGLTLYYSRSHSSRYGMDPIRFSGLLCMLFSGLFVFAGLCFWICETTRSDITDIQNVPEIQIIGIQDTSPRIGRHVDYSQDLPPSYEDAIKYSPKPLTRPIHSSSSTSASVLPGVMSVTENITSYDLTPPPHHLTVSSNYLAVPSRSPRYHK